jgi:hypothetical protein
MKAYFCDNPKCKAHVMTDITINIITLPTGYGLETRNYTKHKYVYAHDGGFLFFCNVCAEAIKIAGRVRSPK